MRDFLIFVLLTAVIAALGGAAITYTILRHDKDQAVREIEAENATLQRILLTERTHYMDSLLLSAHKQYLIQVKLDSTQRAIDSVDVVVAGEKAKLKREIARLKNSTVKELENEAEIAYRNAALDSIQ